MTSDDVRPAIREFITTQLAHRAEHREVGDGDDVISSGLVDSLGIVKLVGFLEESFAIRIRDDEILPENFSSIDAIAAFVATTAQGGTEGAHARR
jgi:acyl carrier protein